MDDPTSSQQQPRPAKKSVFFCNPLKCRCGGLRIPQRVILAIMLHILLQTNFGSRVVLNVAIVEMVGQPKAETYNPPACPQYGSPNHTHKGGVFPWPQTTKALVLYAFYIGYTLTQVPGGWLSDKFGARHVIAGALVMSILSTALFPIMTHQYGYLAAVGLRFVLGASHGPCIPAISSMVSTWIPPKERAVWGGISYGGANLGIVMGMLVSGMLIRAFDGWPIAFYVWAAYSTCYFLLFLCYVFSFPDTHPFISEEEAGHIRRTVSRNRSVMRRSLHTPWKAILLNIPYWANIAAHFGHNYIYFSLITYLPTYLKEILRFDVADGGFYAAFPFIALWVMSLLLSFTSNLFLRCMSQHTFDKFFGAGCNVGSALFALGAVYAGCNRFLCISLYVVSMIVKAFYYVTLPVNINALSKNYGGIMFGLNNAISSLSGIISNHVIGSITKDKQLYEWKLAYWVTLGVAMATTVIYFLFSSAERQDFDYEEGEERDT